MLKYLLCIILGIIIYLFLNYTESFSIGSVRVDLWHNTETGIYRLINRDEGGGFSPEDWEIIVEDEEITDDQFERILEIIDEHPCEDPVVLFNVEDAIPEGLPPSVLECKIRELTKDSGCRTCLTRSEELAELLQPLYDHQSLEMAQRRLAFSKCAALSDDILEMIGGMHSPLRHYIDATGNIQGGYFNIDVALNILSDFLSTTTGAQGGMDYATVENLFSLLRIIISLLRLGISSSKILEILNKPYDSPDRIPLILIRLEEVDIQLYILTAYLYAIDPVLVLDGDGNLNYDLTLDDLIDTAHTISTQHQFDHSD